MHIHTRTILLEKTHISQMVSPLLIATNQIILFNDDLQLVLNLN